MLLIALGNPYLLRALPQGRRLPRHLQHVQPSESAAAKAIFGEIPISGRLPVTIPGLANYGEGISLNSQTSTATAPGSPPRE